MGGPSWATRGAAVLGTCQVPGAHQMLKELGWTKVQNHLSLGFTWFCALAFNPSPWPAGTFLPASQAGANFWGARLPPPTSHVLDGAVQHEVEERVKPLQDSTGLEEAPRRKEQKRGRCEAAPTLLHGTGMCGEAARGQPLWGWER